MRLISAVVVLGSLWVACGCSRGDTGPRKYPVVGTFLVNGAPAEQVALTFHHENGEKAGEHRYATAVTDKDGRFELSTNGDRDGAIEGAYQVTFAWLSSKELDAHDMLSGAYSDPTKSTYKVDVPVAGPELPPFELNIPESRIRRSQRR
jgi:hypothetical protein